jgi:hypothetical protein
MAHQRDGGLYERLVARSEADVRALLTELLAAHHAETHADAVFDLLVGTAVLRAVTVGLHDATAFCRSDRGCLDRACVFVMAPRTRGPAR